MAGTLLVEDPAVSQLAAEVVAGSWFVQAVGPVVVAEAAAARSDHQTAEL